MGISDTTVLLSVLALLGTATACGKATLDPTDLDGVIGEGGDTGAGGNGTGNAGTTGGSGGTAGCAPPPPPSPTMPTEGGCFVNEGSGWVAVPCSCELWLDNTEAAPITVGMQLVVAPPDQVPDLDGPLDVEIAFDDPDATWHATWSRQPGNGETFAVTHQAGKTTVRMGEAEVELAPVSLTACEVRKGVAQVLPGDNSAAKLNMHAILDDGTASVAVDGLCNNPPL